MSYEEEEERKIKNKNNKKNKETKCKDISKSIKIKGKQIASNQYILHICFLSRTTLIADFFNSECTRIYKHGFIECTHISLSLSQLSWSPSCHLCVIFHLICVTITWRVCFYSKICVIKWLFWNFFFYLYLSANHELIMNRCI